MGRISQKQREEHCASLKNLLPSQWKNYTEKIEDAVYRYYFLSDDRFAYESKLQNLIHDLTHMEGIVPGEITIEELVKTSSQDLDKKNNGQYSQKQGMIEFESIQEAKQLAQEQKISIEENKSLKDKVEQLKPVLNARIGHGNFLKCKNKCEIVMEDQVYVIQEKQTRRADEPMTIWIGCKKCHDKWKVN